MEIHGLIALLSTIGLHESGPTSLDLDFTAGLLLDVFDVIATTPNNLSPQVETIDRFQVNRDLLFGPFALLLLATRWCNQSNRTYAAILIAFNVRFSPPEPTLVNEIWQILLHHFINLLDGGVEAFFRRARNTKI
jgi:hypothetical protein